MRDDVLILLFILPLWSSRSS